MNDTDDATLKVGELAERAGLTVRTLHYYHELGLLEPARRSAAGHRLYGPAELRRLQKIRSLQALGLELDAIARYLDRADASLEGILSLHLERLRDRAGELSRLIGRIEGALDRLATDEAAGPTEEDLLEIVRLSSAVERHYTPEQLDRLDTRAAELGEEAIREVEEEWPRLIARVREAMEAGVDPSSDEVRALARRWGELVEMFTGGDPGIRESLGRAYREEGDLGRAVGLDRELLEYVSRAQPS